MTLKLYNTLTKEKDEFKPLKGKKVSLYTCGPTVYNYAHIGNLRAYVFADVLKRTLDYNGYKVKQVMNITDVGHLTSDADTGEDKLEKGAKREGKTVWEIAKFYEQTFKEDIKKLNISEPDVWARATEHIPEQIKLIKKLAKNGYTYETKQGLYFDISKFKDYTALSRQKLEDKKVGSRCEVHVDPEKKHPADFALWLKRVGRYKNHVMHWESPWGDGFPGWHIECSAISMKHLGKQFDIHTGGIDHIPVHHTNERAQNIGAIGHQVVQRWMHNEFLVIGQNDKMAKSGENFITLQTLIDKGFNPLIYRYFCLTTHYRKALGFSWEALATARQNLNHLNDQAEDLLDNKLGKVIESFKDKFLDAINDDLNTPKALAVVQEMLKSDSPDEDKKITFLDFDNVLGLMVQAEIPTEVKELVEERSIAKEKKDYQKADKLKVETNKLGYTIKDGRGSVTISGNVKIGGAGTVRILGKKFKLDKDGLIIEED